MASSNVRKDEPTEDESQNIEENDKVCYLIIFFSCYIGSFSPNTLKGRVVTRLARLAYLS